MVLRDASASKNIKQSWHRAGTSCQDVGVDCIPRNKEPKSSTTISTSTTTTTFSTTTTEKASPAQIIDRLLSGNLKTNQQRAKRFLPPEKFRKVLPGLDAPQTYVDFILAIGKFPHLCSWRKCSRELSAIIAFANKSRCAGGKTTNLHIRQHFDLGNKESEVQGSSLIAQMADIGFKVVLLKQLNQKWKQKHF